MAKHLVESEFEVIPSDGAVEVIFIPTSSHYTFSRLSNRRDIAEFSLLSPDPRIRHAGQAAAAITQPPKFDIWHSAWPQKPQGGAGQDDASETMTPRRFPAPRLSGASWPDYRIASTTSNRARSASSAAATCITSSR